MVQDLRDQRTLYLPRAGHPAMPDSESSTDSGVEQGDTVVYCDWCPRTAKYKHLVKVHAEFTVDRGKHTETTIKRSYKICLACEGDYFYSGKNNRDPLPISVEP